MTDQERKLMNAMAVVVDGLNDLESILPAIRDLGRRHAGYRVDPRHYQTVGAALLWTLEQGLGDDFTDEARHAWAAAYGLLSSTMIEAGAREAA
jgi:hemoglobin-like flavoprotein